MLVSECILNVKKWTKRSDGLQISKKILITSSCSQKKSRTNSIYCCFKYRTLWQLVIKNGEDNSKDMYQINIKIKNVVDFKMVGVSEICYEHAKKYLLQ